MITNINNALALAAQNLPVFPVWNMRADGTCACGAVHPEGKNAGKHPITPRGLNDATTDADQIARWWAVAPEANIGVAVPDGVIVVDVDPRNGGEPTFDALEAKHGKFPVTRAVVTGGAGGHFYFRVPLGFALPSTLGKGIDVKQLGGYVLAPPSNHASGATYRWAGGAEAAITDAPPWIMSLGWTRGERVTVVVEDEENRIADDTALGQIVALVEPHFIEGKKHHIAKNLGGWMKQRGFGPGDVAYVVERLPSTNPRARAKAAVAAFGIERPFGWTELRGLLGEAPAAALDTVTPNPRRAAATEAVQSLAESMAAAVPAPPPPVESPTPLPAWFVPVDLSEVPPPLDYVVRDLELAPGRPNMIVGYSNAGKSIAAQALAFAIAMGLPAWGQFPTSRRRVLYLDAENILVTRENFARLAYAAAIPLAEMAQWLTVVDSHFYMDGPNSEMELAAVIQHKRYGAVFVDTFRASTQVAEENKAEVRKPLEMLKRVSVGLNVMFTVLHHEKKPSDGDKRGSVEFMISGHASIHGSIQVGLSLIHDDENGTISVRPSKKIRIGFEPFNLKIVDVGASSIGEAIAAGVASVGVRVDYVGANVAPKPATEDTMSAALTRILVWLRSNAAHGQQVRCDTVLRTRELGGVGGKKSTNMAAMERLERDGQVHVSGSPRMIALVVDAPPYDPRSIAPPESADRPPISQSLGDFRAALPRRDEDE